MIETVISDETLMNIIDSVTEYMYCNWKKCHMAENMTWHDLETVRTDIKNNAMSMIRTNLHFH